jgi:membrane protease YdiL (CAAX protease family)
VAGLRDRLSGVLADIRRADGQVAVVLVTSALALTFLEFGPIRHAFDTPDPRTLPKLTRWSAGCALAYLVVPALIVRFVFGARLRDYGLTFRGFLRHLPVYAVLYLLVLPFVIPAAFSPHTAKFYPFFKGAGDGLGPFIRWQIVYGLQFLSLEFFFRGFLLFGLEKRFGVHAILVMIVPYCMIHFRKSWPESVAAIAAGLVLGLLALRTRSVLGGVLIHWAVAITMDACAIASRGGFGPP